MSEALRLAEALEQQFPIGTAQHYLDGEAAAELRRLHAENAELAGALKWIGDRCPAILLDQPLHRGLHMEAAYDAGACARAALAKVEESK